MPLLSSTEKAGATPARACLEDPRTGPPVDAVRLIPAGEFLMCSAKSPQEFARMYDVWEGGAKNFADERPQHITGVDEYINCGEGLLRPGKSTCGCVA